MRHPFLCAAALAALCIPASAAWSDPASQCGVHPFPAGGPSGLGATVFSILNYDVPAGVTSVSGSASLPLYPSWNLFLGNGSSTTVTSPTIATSSGSVVASSCSASSLDPGQQLNLGLSAPGSVQNGDLGYDSSASVSPAVVPAAGGEVTERFSVTLRDPRLAGGDIKLSTGNGDMAVLAQAVPQNLDQREVVSTDGNQWELANAQLDKTYVFTASVRVGLAGAASAPFAVSATGFIQVSWPGSCEPCGARTAGASVAVADASLRGAFDLTVDQSDETWASFHLHLLQTNYPYTTAPLACKNGGWRAYGVFDNQGDCVSYVATDGRNEPAGG